MSSGHDTIYLSAIPSRYFLLPSDHALPAGDLALRALDGSDEQRVDAAAAAVFEVSEAAARAHVQATLDAALKQASNAFAGFVNFASLLDQQATPLSGASSTPPDLAAIAALLGSNAAELQRNPQVIRAGVQSLVGEVQAALGDAADADPARQATARDRLRFLRASLQARGVDPGDGFEQLPEQLNLLARLGDEQTTHDMADRLRAFADEVDESPEVLGRRIDAVIADLEQRFGGLMGETKPQRAVRKQREYADGARNAIAEALRARGITPLNTGADKADSSKRADEM